jgi:hypothetical protein
MLVGTLGFPASHAGLPPLCVRRAELGSRGLHMHVSSADKLQASCLHPSVQTVVGQELGSGSRAAVSAPSAGGSWHSQGIAYHIHAFDQQHTSQHTCICTCLHWVNETATHTEGSANSAHSGHAFWDLSCTSVLMA